MKEDWDSAAEGNSIFMDRTQWWLKYHQEEKKEKKEKTHPSTGEKPKCKTYIKCTYSNKVKIVLLVTLVKLQCRNTYLYFYC